MKKHFKPSLLALVIFLIFSLQLISCGNKEENYFLTTNTSKSKLYSLSKKEAFDSLKEYITYSLGEFNDSMNLSEAPSNKFAKELNIDKIKKDYYVFFLQWKDGGTKVYLVNKATGDIFDYSVTGEITPVN